MNLHQHDWDIESLTGYLFPAPPWYHTLPLLILLGFAIDLVTLPHPGLLLFGSRTMSIPGIAAILITYPLVEVTGSPMSWNRSSLLALFGVIFSVLTISAGLIVPGGELLFFLFGFSLGVVFGIRLLVLAAIADHRFIRMIPAALVQSLAMAIGGAAFFPSGFWALVLVAHLAVGGGCILFIWLTEQPLMDAHNISIFHFLNAFLAYLNGEPGLDRIFRAFGEQVTVPQGSLVFRRERRPDTILTSPNIHPGPLGDIGGGILPRVLHASFPGEVLVAHGCATHDFNPVSQEEIQIVVKAVQESLKDLTFHPAAGRSRWFLQGSVSLLGQRFGDSILLVATRSPSRTEDLDLGLGLTFLAEGNASFAHTIFVDAHNSAGDIGDGVYSGTRIATDYHSAVKEAVGVIHGESMDRFRIGVSRVPVPYSLDQGFADLGIQALVVEAQGQKTAYVLMDGNNIAPGAREIFTGAIRDLADHGEVMTTDTHLVNTISGKNPIGQEVPPEEIVPYVRQAVQQATDDLAPSEVAGATSWCRNVTVFGNQRIAQLVSTVNTTFIFLAPVGIAIFFASFLLTVIAFQIMF
jgi:putative membrane protein